MIRHQAVCHQVGMGQQMLSYQRQEVEIVLRIQIEQLLPVVSLVEYVIEVVRLEFHKAVKIYT